MNDHALIDDLQKFIELSARIVEPLHALANTIDYAGEFRRAFITHQHADMIRDAGEVARYQAREMARE